MTEITLEELRAAHERLSKPLASDDGIYRVCCHTRVGYSHGAFCAMPYLTHAIALIEQLYDEDEEGWEGIDGDPG